MVVTGHGMKIVLHRLKSACCLIQKRMVRKERKALKLWRLPDGVAVVNIRSFDVGGADSGVVNEFFGSEGFVLFQVHVHGAAGTDAKGGAGILVGVLIISAGSVHRGAIA